MSTHDRDRENWYVGNLTLLKQYGVGGGEQKTESLEAMRELHDQAVAELGPNNRPTLLIGLAIEEALSSNRPAAESRAAFEDLALQCQINLRASDRIAMSVRSLLAQYTRKAGDLDGGIGLYRQELALRERMFEVDGYHTCMLRANLAVALRFRGRRRDLDEAERLTDEEVEVRQRRWGPDHAFTWVAMMGKVNHLLLMAEGSARRKADRQAAAGEALLLASEIADRRARRLGPRHTGTIRALRAKARCLLVLGETERATWILWRLHSIELVEGTADPGSTPLFLAMTLAANPEERARAMSLVRQARIDLEQNEDMRIRRRQADALIKQLG